MNSSRDVTGFWVVSARGPVVARWGLLGGSEGLVLLLNRQLRLSANCSLQL